MKESEEKQVNETHGFKRQLNLFDSTMIVAGSMIGSGIFIVSAEISRTVGGGGWLLAIWLITGIITVMGALSYGELAGMMPYAGGQYVYLRESLGTFFAFLYGWTLFLVIQTGTIAAVAVAFGKFLGVLIPALSENTKIIDLHSAGFNFSIAATQIVGVLLIIFLTYINTLGIKTGKIVQNIFTVTKIGSLVTIIVVVFIFSSKSSALSLNMSTFFNASWTKIVNGRLVTETLSGLLLFGALGAAMVGSLFSSDAWNNITFIAGEVVNPRKTIPYSLAIGTLLVTALYFITNVAYIMVLPVKGSPDGSDILLRGIQFANTDLVATAAAEVSLGQAGAVVIALLIIISTFGCTNGLILAGARVYYAMAHDRLFFRKMTALNHHKVPAFSLIVQAFWACLLCLSGTYGNLLDYVIFAVLLFYSITIIGLFILRIKNPNAPRPYKAFGYPVIPALYILAALLIAIDLLMLKPTYTWPGLIIVLLGIPVYYIWKKKNTVQI
ncbi:MAG: amino acid transporter [Candidatus Fischerbacteria bacterium RBG_13_37_8]|uniref:Amino acid transporter n=1 Tax=Candidatus Fischerbacteria bacterium RBG_13_37_8 TaxID=1817863 RepID=A0A1F5V789_9BACT|nr:MAG: amino acid transporter [Candidatus Fischerbacteria bacterium RBG_13_37_8]